MADSVVIAPDVCPICGVRFLLRSENDTLRCRSCGELVYDESLGVWKIRKIYNDYNDGLDKIRINLWRETKMSEQNGSVGTVNGGQQVPEAQGAQVPPQEPVQQAANPAQQTAEPPKQNWFKKHWKGVAGSAAAVVTVLGTGFVAWKKGKAAGIMSVPTPPQEDYSLDPNK